MAAHCTLHARRNAGDFSPRLITATVEREAFRVSCGSRQRDGTPSHAAQEQRQRDRYTSSVRRVLAETKQGGAALVDGEQVGTLACCQLEVAVHAILCIDEDAVGEGTSLVPGRHGIRLWGRGRGGGFATRMMLPALPRVRGFRQRSVGEFGNLKRRAPCIVVGRVPDAVSPRQCKLATEGRRRW